MGGSDLLTTDLSLTYFNLIISAKFTVLITKVSFFEAYHCTGGMVEEEEATVNWINENLQAIGRRL